MRQSISLWLVVIAISLGLSACGSSQPYSPTIVLTPTLSPASTLIRTAAWTASATSTVHRTATSTPTPIRTRTATTTHVPTRTYTPTQTLFPTLPPLGPYLLYKIYTGAENGPLTILGGRGQGRRVIDFPQDGYLHDLKRAISPDGKWLAFYRESNQSDRSLSLMYIPDGSLHPITPLFADDETAARVRYSHALDWSPDGRQLAFAGSMDSALSDVYVYQLETQSIRKLTDISVDIGYLTWSPDGEWIVFESISAAEGGVYEDSTMHFINLNDAQPAAITLESGLWSAGSGWIAPDKYLLYTGSEGCCGPHSFRYYNLRTLEKVSLWEPGTASYAMDPDNGILAVSNAPEMELQGSYFIDMQGNATKFSERLFWILVYRGGKASQFLGFTGYEVMAIRADGAITQVSGKPYNQAAVSPDKRWFVLYDAYDRVVGIDLFSEADQFVRTITDKEADLVLWRPDSQGLFFMAGSLYYVAMPNGEPVVVDTCEPDGCHITEDYAVWIP